MLETAQNQLNLLFLRDVGVSFSMTVLILIALLERCKRGISFDRGFDAIYRSAIVNIVVEILKPAQSDQPISCLRDFSDELQNCVAVVVAVSCLVGFRIVLQTTQSVWFAATGENQRQTENQQCKR
jgi:hypothetical protein